MKFRLTAVLVASTLLSNAALAEDQFFTSNGTKLRYVVQGEGEPLVLIHGFTASVEMNWQLPGIMGALARDYKVIAIDNRGHGKSEKPHDVAQYGPQMSKDIVNLLDYLELPKAHIAGYSMGGFITLHLLATHPERVHSAIIGGAGWNDGSGATGPSDELVETLAKSLENGTGISPLIEALTPPGQPKPTAEEMKATNTLMMATNDPLALAAAVRSMVNMTVTKEQLMANKVPTVGIVGEIDPLKAATDAMYAHMKNTDPMVVVPGGDHISALSNPAFVKGMQDFLKNHPMSAKTLAPAGSGAK